MLYFRPHDVELVDGCGGCIAGTVAASRRVAGTRRVELEIGGERQRVEIELPFDHPAAQQEPHRLPAAPLEAVSGPAA